MTKLCLTNIEAFVQEESLTDALDEAGVQWTAYTPAIDPRDGTVDITLSREMSLEEACTWLRSVIDPNLLEGVKFALEK